MSAFSHLEFEGYDVPAISCRSLLIYTKAEPRGILFRVGEHVLIQSNLNELVIHVINFFSICNSGQYYTVVKGSLFNSYEENPDSDKFTVTASSTIILVNAANILRKVMLYPGDDSPPTSYDVIDYHRLTLPSSIKDVVVPIYPTVGDMVQVCGSGNETWYALVRSVNIPSKTCVVNFYVEDDVIPGRYRRETFLRRHTETLDWDSILDVAKGTWSGSFWYISTSSCTMHS